MQRQSTMIALIVVLMMALCDSTTANPLIRVRRQGWSWDGTGEFRPRPSTQPPSPWLPTVTPPGTMDGEDPNSTTTTASPAYAQCMANCRTTKQYNPVCGTNRVTYENQALLNCASNCGVAVKFMFNGTCAPVTR